MIYTSKEYTGMIYTSKEYTGMIYIPIRSSRYIDREIEMATTPALSSRNSQLLQIHTFPRSVSGIQQNTCQG